MDAPCPIDFTVIVDIVDGAQRESQYLKVPEHFIQGVLPGFTNSDVSHVHRDKRFIGLTFRRFNF